MGLFGGSTSRSGSAQKWAKPFAKAAAGNVQGVVNENADNLQNLTNQVSGLVPDAINKYKSGNDGVQASGNFITDVLGGRFLDRAQTNPFLDKMIGQTAGDVTSRVNANFGSRGAFGGTAHTTALGKALAEAENGLRYQDFQQQYQNESAEIDRMAGAAGMSPGIAQAEFVGLPEILQASGLGAELPYTGINSLSNNLAALFSGGKSKQSTGIGGILGGIGSIASGAGAMGARF